MAMVAIVVACTHLYHLISLFKLSMLLCAELQALANTVLVIGMVGASSVILFAINSTLAELTSRYYTK